MLRTKAELARELALAARWFSGKNPQEPGDPPGRKGEIGNPSSCLGTVARPAFFGCLDRSNPPAFFAPHTPQAIRKTPVAAPERDGPPPLADAGTARHPLRCGQSIGQSSDREFARRFPNDHQPVVDNVPGRAHRSAE